jgi:hypothetical protein
MGGVAILLAAAAFVAGCNDSKSSTKMIVHTIIIPTPPAEGTAASTVRPFPAPAVPLGI